MSQIRPAVAGLWKTGLIETQNDLVDPPLSTDPLESVERGKEGLTSLHLAAEVVECQAALVHDFAAEESVLADRAQGHGGPQGLERLGWAAIRPQRDTAQLERCSASHAIVTE